jgi:hypothetical protein
LHGTLEPCSEQRIDHNVTSRQPTRFRGFSRACPSLRRKCRITLEPVERGRQNSHSIPSFLQNPGGNKAVAAIVARPSHHGDARAGRMACDDAFRHCAAGILHQVDSGGSARYSETVSLSHLGVSEQFDHCSSLIRAPSACESSKLAMDSHTDHKIGSLLKF